MVAPKVLDLDTELGLDGDVPITTRRVKLLGIEVDIVCDLNSFGLMSVTGDNVEMGAVMEFLKSMIAPASWPTFQHAAANHPQFRGDGGANKMMEMVRRLMEVASDPYPTKRPSDLPRGASTRSTVQKLPVKPASARAKASKN